MPYLAPPPKRGPFLTILYHILHLPYRSHVDLRSWPAAETAARLWPRQRQRRRWSRDGGACIGTAGEAPTVPGICWKRPRLRPRRTTAVGSNTRTVLRIRFRRRRRRCGDGGLHRGGTAATSDGRLGDAAATVADSPAADIGDEDVRSAMAAAAA